jgi:hypothetical protein
MNPYTGSISQLLGLTQQQIVDLQASGVTEFDVVDTAANIKALTVPQITQLATIPITDIDASDGSVSLSAAQAVALEAGNIVVNVPDGAFVTLADTAANLESLTASELSGLGGIGIDAVAVTDLAARLLSLTTADLNALAAVQQAVSGTSGQPTYVVVDTSEDVSANFDAINNDPSISSIDLTNSGTLKLTAAQALDDTTAEKEITSPGSWSIAISDTAQDITANLSALDGDSRVTSLTADIDPNTFSGTLPDLGDGNSFDLSGISATGTTVTGTTLTVTESNGQTLDFQVDPSLSGMSFDVQADGNGGTTLVEYNPNATAQFVFWGDAADLNAGKSPPSSGSWDDGADWSTIDQGNKYVSSGVPTANSNVELSGTVSFDTTSTVNGIAGFGVLQMNGGTLTVLQSFSTNYAVDMTGGQLVIHNGDGFGINHFSEWNNEFDQTGGILEIDAGSLDTFWHSYVAGTISGAGILAIDENSSIDFEPGAVLTVSFFELEPIGNFQLYTYPTATLHEDLDYAGTLYNDGIFNLNGFELTLSGDLEDFTSGIFEGPGTLDIEGAADVSDLTIEGDVTLIDDGSIVQSSVFSLEGALQIGSTGTYQITGDDAIGTGDTLTIDNADTFWKSGGTGPSLIDEDSFTNAGTLEVDSGTLEFAGSVDLGGTVTGAGTVQFDGPVTIDALVSLAVPLYFISTNTLSIGVGSTLSLSGGGQLGGAVSETGGLGASTLVLDEGSFILDAGLSLSVAQWTINSADVTLDGDLNYSGTFNAETYAHIDMAAATLTLSGDVTIGGTITGEGGSVFITGAGTDAIAAPLTLEAEALLEVENGAAVTQEDDVELGTSSGDTSELKIDAGASYYLDGGNIGDGSNSGLGGTTLIDNLGTFVVDAATVVNPSFDNENALTIVGAATLELDGGSTLFGGNVVGLGTLRMEMGSYVLDPGISVSVATWTLADLSDTDVADIVLGDDLTYGGTFLDGFNGNFDLSGFDLTLSGSNSVLDGVAYGPGSIIVTGSASAGDGFVVAGQVVFEDAGAITQDGDIKLGLEEGDTAQLLIDAGKEYLLQTADILDGSNTGAGGITSVNNKGTFEASSTDGDPVIIDPSFLTTGTLTVDADTVLGLEGAASEFGGTVNRAGELDLESGSNTFDAGLALSVANLALGTSSGDPTLALSGDLSYAGSFTEGPDGTIELEGHQLTLSGDATLGGAINGAGGVIMTGPVLLLDGFSINYDANVAASGSALTNDGLASIDNGSTFNIADGVSADPDANGAFDIGVNATLEFGGTVAGDQTIDFDGDDGTLTIDDLAHSSKVDGSQQQDFNASLSGFDDTDTIKVLTSGLGDFSDITEATPGTYNAASDTTALSLDDDGSLVATLKLIGDYTGYTFTAYPLSGNVEITATPCHCPGTLIRVRRGQKPVERLKIGDMVKTKSGALRPIKLNRQSCQITLK